MTETRRHFHDELADLEHAILDIADRADRMVEMAVRAVVEGDEELAARVIAADDQVDAIYLDVHQRWIELMALQQPMAGDLRLLSCLLHMNITLERMGDQCVNIAKMARVTAGLPRSERILERIREMADLVRPMIRTAAQAFVRRDADEARLLPAMDEPIDRLNRTTYEDVVECADDKELLRWATRMMMVSRAIERIGDQAVDIGEQLVFLLTGEFTEWTGQEFDEGFDGAGRSG